MFDLSLERPILGDNPKVHHEKYAFHVKNTEKQQKQLIQHRSLILTWYFIEQREGKLGISYILVVFGGAHVCLVVHVVHVCVCGVIGTVYPNYGSYLLEIV